jgi:hypothetical protein
MQTNEIAEFLIFVISFENNLIAPEIRMGRMI